MEVLQQLHMPPSNPHHEFIVQDADVDLAVAMLVHIATYSRQRKSKPPR